MYFSNASALFSGFEMPTGKSISRYIEKKQQKTLELRFSIIFSNFSLVTFHFFGHRKNIVDATSTKQISKSIIFSADNSNLLSISMAYNFSN